MKHTKQMIETNDRDPGSSTLTRGELQARVSRNAPALMRTTLAMVVGGMMWIGGAQAADRVTGVVTDVFGQDVILDRGGERFLVRGLDRAPALDTEITVRGELQGNTLTQARFADQPSAEPRTGSRAERHSADGREAQRAARADSAPSANWGAGRFAQDRWNAPTEMHLPRAARDQLSALGLGEVGYLEPKSSHVRGYTTNAQGLPVEVKFEYDGSLREYGVAKSLRKQMRNIGRYQSISPQNLIQAVESEGFRNARVIDFKKRHAEVLGEHAELGLMRLDVAPDGTILKARVQPQGWWGG
ncbi:MAG: hypothetical protein ACK4IT_00025 [Thioalkalivibrionaceae bacterium]